MDRPVANSNHDEPPGSALDLFAADSSAPGPGSPRRIIVVLGDEDSTSLFPSERVPSDRDERLDSALDVFAAETDGPSGITAAPKNEDSTTFFPSERVTSVDASTPAPQRESVFVRAPVPDHPVPLMEVALLSRAPATPAAPEIPRAGWRRVAAASVLAGLVSAGLLGRMVIEQRAVPPAAVPVDSPARRTPLPATPTAERPTESVTATPPTATPPLGSGATPPRRSEANDVEPSQKAAPRPAVQGRSVTAVGARASQSSAPAIPPPVPAPSTFVPAPRAESMLTAHMPASDVPTTPVAPALGRVETPTAAVSPPAAAASPPAAVAAPPARDPAPPPGAADTEAVGSILRRYRSAFAALDATAVEAFWPSVNSKALGNAFDQLESQSFDFDTCEIDVQGSRAEAVCSGRASFVPKVGGKHNRVESRRWTFHLTRAGTSWLIERVGSR
jgi:hypothetical protein